MKGLIEWIYEMVVGIMEYAAKELVGVMSMDMAYFEQTAPVIKDITNIILALGWGMLIANMVFSVHKSNDVRSRFLKAKIRSIYFAEHLCLHFYFLHQNRYVILLWV